MIDMYRYVLRQVSSKDIITMLLTEDHQGLRPLELTVHLGTWGLFKVIFNTDSVYLVETQRLGIFRVYLRSLPSVNIVSLYLIDEVHEWIKTKAKVFKLDIPCNMVSTTCNSGIHVLYTRYV